MCKNNNKKQPIRRCIACNEMKIKQDMLRIVRVKSEDSSFRYTVDESMKLNGRGAYICKSHTCLEKAKKSRGLERSYKMSVPQEAYLKMEEEINNIEK